MVVSYTDAGNVQDPSEADQVMWGQVTADSGFRVMAYDVPSRMPWSSGENTFFLSVRGDRKDQSAGAGRGHHSAMTSSAMASPSITKR